MGKVKWYKNYYKDGNGIKRLEWLAYTETKCVRINRTRENLLLLEKSKKEIDVWEFDSMLSFNLVKEAKNYGAEWLNQ